MRNFVICLFVFLFASPGAAGKAATVYYPKDPDPAEKTAAYELARYWQRLTGEETGVYPEPQRPEGRHRFRRFAPWAPLPHTEGDGLRFYVGETRAARLHLPLPGDLDRHGFRVGRSGKHLFLRGETPLATRFAVDDFLVRFGGVRWYLPTELGEHVPALREELPREIDYVETPDFLSRRWSNATRSRDDTWERRNKLAGRDNFHHSLYRIFTEAVYEVRPDFFIEINAERIRPDDDLRGHNFQICFGNPDAAKFAARRAAEFFDQNPEAASFSLGMNDTEMICQCSLCQRWVDPEKTFRSRPDYSDLLFTFMNRAAEELSKTHPDKFLGCLAYHWAENVPSFPVHPKVMPYLTADRGQWHDEAFRQNDRDLMKRWSEAGPERIGIYDYYYGSSFVIPRLFTKVTKDSLEHARAVGIDGFYAEIYSTWSVDGPKAWLASQLLWDVSQEREVLLDDFYQKFFGEAAEPMRRFFDRCEEIWMTQGGPAFWLKFFHDFTQLELFPPKVNADLRALLAEAAELAESDQVRERVRLVSEGFHLTELYSESYHRIKEASARVEGSSSLEWGALVELIERSLADRAAVETFYEDVIFPNELHRPVRRLESKAGFFPGMKLNRLVERAASLADTGEKRAELARLVRRLKEILPESRAETVLAAAQETSTELLFNGDFEVDASWTGMGEKLAGNVDYTPFSWERETAPGTSPSFALTDVASRSGEFALGARGVVRERLSQRFSPKPNAIYRFSGWARGEVSPGSRVEIQISWRDQKGRVLAEEYRTLDRLLPGAAEGWQELLVFATAPVGAVQGSASLLVQNQGPDDFVYFDDVSLQVFTVQP